MGYRLLGLLVLATGWILVKYGIFAPLSDMAHGVRVVKVSTLASFVIPPTLVLGGLFLLFGRRAYALMVSDDEQAPSAFGVAAVVTLILCGIPLKMWMDGKVAAHGYAVPVYKSNITLSGPLKVSFQPDAIQAEDEHGRIYTIKWNDLSKINIVANPDTTGTHYQICWEFVGRDYLWVELPLGAAQDKQMLDQIREHAGPIERDPVNDMKSTVAKAPYKSKWVQEVWSRN